MMSIGREHFLSFISFLYANNWLKKQKYKTSKRLVLLKDKKKRFSNSLKS